MMDQSMLPDFIAETEEHLEEMEANLLQLEAVPADKDALDNVFRTVHSIKGNAEYLGIEKIAILSHRLENLLEILRKEPMNMNMGFVEILIQVRDRMSMLVSDLSNTREERTEIRDLVERLDRYSDAHESETATALSSDAEFMADDLFSDSDGAENGFSEIDPDLVSDETRRFYEELKGLLMDITRGVMDNDKKCRILDILDDLLAASGEMGYVARALNSLKQQADTLSFPDDAGDMLADLNKLIDSTQLISNGQTTQLKEPAPEIKHNSAPPEPVENDTYEDETDEELFQIFIQHLKENLSALRQLSNELKGSDDYDAGLKKCLEKIDSLKTSANYMDYKKIVVIYEKWAVEIDEYRGSLFLEEDETFDVFINAGMDGYIDTVIRFFPQCRDELIEEIGGAGTGEAPVRAHPEGEAVGHEGTQRDDDVVIVDDDVFGDESFDAFSEYQDPGDDSDIAISEQAGDEKGGASEISEPGETDEISVFDEQAGNDTKGLFDELDSVFDGCGGGQAGTGDRPQHEPYLRDLEEELTSGVVARREKDVPETVSATGVQELVGAPEPLQEPGQKTEPDMGGGPETGPEQTPQPEVPEEMFQEPESETLVFSEADPESRSSDEIKPSTVVEGSPVKKSVRVDARKIDSLMNQAGELVVSRAGFSQLYSEMVDFQHDMQDGASMASKDLKQLKSLIFRLNESIISLGRVANELQDGVMKVRMLPISQLFNRYPRLVRDLTHGTEKTVSLDIKGEETELDKMVIEAIADPLVHIIRNAIDHGAETVKERAMAGKPEACTLKLESYHESNHVVIEIIDDGRGIDTVKIRKSAVDKGLLPSEELARMSEKEIIGLIMMPGFSTSNKVTTTSGRGVGMDVVKKNIEKLNGTIEVESKKGLGTRIRIKIPLTLAIIKALLVKVGREVFTIPLATVEETLQINRGDLSFIEGVEVIKLRDSVLSLLRLSDLFNIRSASEISEKVYVVVVNTGMRQVGLVVDALLGQEETVIKPLVDYLQENSGFSGATILGDGSISLILDVYELINISIGTKTLRRKTHAVNEDFRHDVIERFAEQERETDFTIH